MNAQYRRGACPALSAPMMTGDGLLVRLNLSEGGIAPRTLAELCQAAMRHGNGLVEITARGSFQVRGLTPSSAPLFAAEVDALDIPVRDGVPVETSPLAGLDPQEIADPRPLVRAIRAQAEREGLSRRLGPKVSVIVDGGGQVSLDAVTADVRVTAQAGGGWVVSAANGEGCLCGDAGRTATVVIEALAAIAALGTAARGKDLSSTLPPSVLPDISPTREEIGQSQTSQLPISPTEREMSGRTEAGATERTRLGLMPLRANRSALAIAVPFGQCDASALASLAWAADGIHDFRFAPGRRLLALGPRPACEALAAAADSLGFIADPADPRLWVAACAGAPACASGLFDARGLGTRIAALLPSGFAGTVHVSGCAKGCAHPAPAALTLAGALGGVAFMRNGRASDAPVALSPDADAALDLLRRELIETAA